MIPQHIINLYVQRIKGLGFKLYVSKLNFTKHLFLDIVIKNFDMKIV